MQFHTSPRNLSTRALNTLCTRALNTLLREPSTHFYASPQYAFTRSLWTLVREPSTHCCACLCSVLCEPFEPLYANPQLTLPYSSTQTLHAYLLLCIAYPGLCFDTCCLCLLLSCCLSPEWGGVGWVWWVGLARGVGVARWGAGSLPISSLFFSFLLLVFVPVCGGVLAAVTAQLLGAWDLAT